MVHQGTGDESHPGAISAGIQVKRRKELAKMPCTYPGKNVFIGNGVVGVMNKMLALVMKAGRCDVGVPSLSKW